MAFSFFVTLFKNAPTKVPLGRWNLKSCAEMSTSLNSIYQNRDHCSDTICKTPKKADEYMDPKPTQKK